MDNDLISKSKLFEDFRNTITEKSDIFDWLNMINRQPAVCNMDNTLERLQHFEDLELKLQKAYGECDGLLEISIKALIEHAEQLKIGRPVKSRILTDDDVERWLRWKELSENGRLLELPCSVGDIVYEIAWRRWCEEEDKYIEELSFECINCNCKAKKEYFIKPISATLACIANIVWHTKNPSDDFRVYLTENEAMKVLEEIKNDRK